MAHTKKVGMVGRLGPRYGVKIREKIAEVERIPPGRCPACLKPAIRRVAAGVWICGKCGLKSAGKAYSPAGF